MMKVYIDANYPKPLVKILEDVHNLQKEKRFEIFRWENDEITNQDLNEAIFLVVDYQKKGISVPVIKQSEDGYKTVVCRVMNKKIDRFEFAMTVLRVWPSIIEKFGVEGNLFSFKYQGKKLTQY